jgi:hypothetical protein
MTRLGERLLAAAPDPPQVPDRVVAVAARVRRRRLLNSALGSTAATAVLAVATVGVLQFAGSPAPHRTPVDTPATASESAAAGTSASATTGPAGSGQPFDTTVEVTDAPDGIDRPTEVTVPGITASSAVEISHVRILAPQGDRAALSIFINGQEFTRSNLSLIRDYDIFPTPRVAVDEPILIRLSCVEPGRTATGQRAPTCYATVQVVGTHKP